MKTRLRKTLMGVFAVLLMAAPALANAEYGTPDEAKIMTEKAVAYYKEHGKELAFAAYNKGTDGFKDKDLYLFIYDKDGTCVSHGANPAMIGKNLIILKDADGKELVKAIIAVQGEGWVEFKWRNPTSKKIMNKKSYIINHDGLWFGVGAYE